jgi:phospholipid/cholesterol/gamma-HCH transport system substrate-binding protein
VRPQTHGYDRELLSGLFVLLGIFVVGLFSLKITDSPVFRPGTEYTVFLSDATGIFKSSKVKISGINVGVVKNIDLVEGKAKVLIILDRGHRIEKGSYVLPRSQGILGDRFLEIVIPENDDERQKLEKNGLKLVPKTEGSTSSFNFLNLLLPMAVADELYRSGDTIPSRQGTASADDVMRKLGDISQDVKVLAKDLKEIIHDNKGDISDSVKAIRRSADNLDLILRDIGEKNTRTDLKQAIHGLHDAVQNIRDISDKINKGEGTIGKLVNDPQTADQLVRALNSINEYLDRAKRTQITVEMSTNYLTETHKSKSFFDLKMMPRGSYGYKFGLVQDPGGRLTKTEKSVIVNGGAPVVTVEESYDKTAFKFNLQFIRKIYSTSLRVGLFESTGGVGFDQELWRDHLFLTAEAFDFGRDNENARVRVLARFLFLDSIFVQAGYDDLAAKVTSNRSKSFFGGIGLSFDDSDLKNFFFLLSGR